jgi:hypothetical protein
VAEDQQISGRREGDLLAVGLPAVVVEREHIVPVDEHGLQDVEGRPVARLDVAGEAAVIRSVHRAERFEGAVRNEQRHDAIRVAGLPGLLGVANEVDHLFLPCGEIAVAGENPVRVVRTTEHPSGDAADHECEHRDDGRDDDGAPSGRRLDRRGVQVIVLAFQGCHHDLLPSVERAVLQPA